ncbi:hypothetical protein F5141DRAFT_1061647 [Pisolithus sp. B1]|nr:hypothetical protein F5141DRAFT_1061647 [Pisolithus sp. B1]
MLLQQKFLTEMPRKVKTLSVPQNVKAFNSLSLKDFHSELQTSIFDEGTLLSTKYNGDIIADCWFPNKILLVVPNANKLSGLQECLERLCPTEEERELSTFMTTLMDALISYYKTTPTSVPQGTEASFPATTTLMDHIQILVHPPSCCREWVLPGRELDDGKEWLRILFYFSKGHDPHFVLGTGTWLGWRAQTGETSLWQSLIATVLESEGLTSLQILFLTFFYLFSSLQGTKVSSPNDPAPDPLSFPLNMVGAASTPGTTFIPSESIPNTSPPSFIHLLQDHTQTLVHLHQSPLANLHRESQETGPQQQLQNLWQVV